MNHDAFIQAIAATIGAPPLPGTASRWSLEFPHGGKLEIMPNSEFRPWALHLIFKDWPPEELPEPVSPITKIWYVGPFFGIGDSKSQDSCLRDLARALAIIGYVPPGDQAAVPADDIPETGLPENLGQRRKDIEQYAAHQGRTIVDPFAAFKDAPSEPYPLGATRHPTAEEFQKFEKTHGPMFREAIFSGHLLGTISAALKSAPEDAAEWRQRLTAAKEALEGTLATDAAQRAAGDCYWCKTEREDVIRILRTVCTSYGSNDWPDNLHLGDVIEKHLYNYLAEEDAKVLPMTEGDESHPLWCLDAQIRGLLEGDGASEDLEAVKAFFRAAGLPESTAARVRDALCSAEVKAGLQILQKWHNWIASGQLSFTPEHLAESKAVLDAAGLPAIAPKG